MQSAVIGMIVSAASVAAAQEDDLAPAAAAAPAPPALGGRDRWVFDLLGGQVGSMLGPLGFVGPFTISSYSSEWKTTFGTMREESTVISLVPSADYFVTDHLSVGARLTAGITSSRSAQEANPQPQNGVAPLDSYDLESHGYTLGAAPRVGYAVPLSPHFAFWPRVGAGYTVTRQMFDKYDGDAISKTYFVEANLGAALRVSKHVLVDLGPIFTYRRITSENADGSLSTVYGLPQNGSSTGLDVSFRSSVRVDF